MNTKIYFSLGCVALFTLLSSDVMALNFPTLPGTGGTGTGSTPADVVIFSCKNANTGTSTSSNSSCSSSGSSSSSCSSTPTTSQSSIYAWEMTGDHPALKDTLNNAATCSEAVKAVGAANCITSGGDTLTTYTCKI